MDWLRELLKKLGVKAEEIDPIVEKAEADKQAAIDEEVKGLKQKNAELISKTKKAKEGEGDKVAELEAKIEELTEALTVSKRDSEKAIKALTKERDEHKAAADGERNAVSKLVLENGLTEALTKAGVKKELLPAARALLREKGVLSVKSEGDIRKAVALLKKDGKDTELDLDGYVKEFAGTDEGKAFIPAGGDSGGGAGGNKGGGKSNEPPKTVADAIAAAGAPPAI